MKWLILHSADVDITNLKHISYPYDCTFSQDYISGFTDIIVLDSNIPDTRSRIHLYKQFNKILSKSQSAVINSPFMKDNKIGYEIMGLLFKHSFDLSKIPVYSLDNALSSMIQESDEKFCKDNNLRIVRNLNEYNAMTDYRGIFYVPKRFPKLDKHVYLERDNFYEVHYMIYVENAKILGSNPWCISKSDNFSFKKVKIYVPDDYYWTYHPIDDSVNHNRISFGNYEDDLINKCKNIYGFIQIHHKV